MKHSEMDIKNCYYCDMPLTNSNIEYDHFPIPARHGGENIVPACKNCHTLKDRIPLSDLKSEFLGEMNLIWNLLSPRGKILMAKFCFICQDALEDLKINE